MQRTFEEVRKLGQKVARADMPAATRLETPGTGNVNALELVEDSAIVLHSEGRPHHTLG